MVSLKAFGETLHRLQLHAAMYGSCGVSLGVELLGSLRQYFISKFFAKGGKQGKLWFLEFKKRSDWVET